MFKKSVSRVYFLLSIGFGIVIGIAFPFYSHFFVDFKSITMGIIFSISCVVAGILVGLGSYLIGKFTIIKSIKKIGGKFKSVNEKENNVITKINFESKDALGELTNNYNQFITHLEELFEHIKEHSDKSKEIGETLTKRTDVSSTSIEVIAYSIENLKEKFSDLNDDINNSSSSVDKITENIKNLSNHIGNQIQVNKTVSNSVEDIMNSINSISEITNEKNESVNMLVEVIKIGGEKVNNTNKFIQSISKSADDILGMIDFITDISNQINTLAINASIEAARAGKYGYGFKVVANEIRNLAVTTSNNTGSIAEYLKETVDKMHMAMDLSVESGKTFAKINKEVTNVSGALFNITDKMNTLSKSSNIIINDLRKLDEASSIVKNSSTEIIDNVDKINTLIHKANSISSDMLGEMNKIDDNAMQLNLFATQLYALGIRNNLSMKKLNEEIKRLTIETTTKVTLKE